MNQSKAFIIGNGFDISLGWNTRYSDFANSEEWPFKNMSEGLAGHLNNVKDKEKWFDIEKELLNYALSTQDLSTTTSGYKRNRYANRIELDLQEYLLLVQRLQNYLNKEQDNQIKSYSSAARILKAIVKNGRFDNIFTFNYTNLNIVADYLHLGEIQFNYVHGSLVNNDIIIGIDDNSKINQSYDYLYKTFNKNYISSPINYALQNADEVVFFGHSLGDTDYHYFKKFFLDQSQPTMSEKQMKRITIFTYDENSRLSILRQLRNMNGGSLEYLYANNDFSIICTDGKDSKDENKINAFEKHMTNSSVAEEQNLLESFVLH